MAVTEVPFDLVEVKFAEPLIRPATVAKRDVIEQLRTSRLPFASIVAPAGYGKTTLPRALGRDGLAPVRLGVARPARRRRRRVPAVRRGRDPSSRAGPCRGLRCVVRTRRLRRGRCGSRRLGSALAELDQPLVLVLDDLHTVSNPSCLDALAELPPSTCQPGSQIVVASREEPNLPLGSLARARLGEREFGVTISGSTTKEAGLLLRAAGVELEPGRASQD